MRVLPEQDTPAEGWKGEQMGNWKDYIRKVEPYVPGEQPREAGIIKLNTNENPYPPSPKVTEALERFSADSLRLYPDPANSVLCEALASCYGLDTSQVFAGVGSDDVLSLCFLTFFNSDKPILFPDITYSFYDVWADLYRIPYLTRPLREDFTIRREDYFIENGGIIFPNPNAPTGVYEPLELIEDILKHNPSSLMIVDEAYIDFAGKPSAVSLLSRYENLLVVQTFSKSRSLAGMRIGYALGSPALIRALNDVKYSFNSYTLSRPALEIGTAAVLDTEYFAECTARIIRTREESKQILKELGFSFPDSASNFIFARHEQVPAAFLFEELKKQGIYVRYFNRPRISDYLRITVGTDEQMQRFFTALRMILQGTSENRN